MRMSYSNRHEREGGLSAIAPLMEIAKERERGPSPSFTPAQLVLAFLVIGDEGTIGRQALARMSGLGDGAVRTVLKKLREDGYVDVNASGCSLTRPGRKLYAGIRQKIAGIVLLERSPLTVGSKQAAVEVKGGAPMVRGGIEQRDSAIKVGASGATTYVIKGSKFTIPGGSLDCERDFPSPVWRKLRRELHPEDGDALVLSGSDDQMESKLGALAAALTLV